MQIIHQPISIQELYFKSPFSLNTFSGPNISKTDLPQYQSTMPDYTASLESINAKPELVKPTGSYFKSNILLIGAFTVLIGVGAYYYYKYRQTTKEQNNYQ